MDFYVVIALQILLAQHHELLSELEWKRLLSGSDDCRDCLHLCQQ